MSSEQTSGLYCYCFGVQDQYQLSQEETHSLTESLTLTTLLLLQTCKHMYIFNIVLYGEVRGAQKVVIPTILLMRYETWVQYQLLMLQKGPTNKIYLLSYSAMMNGIYYPRLLMIPPNDFLKKYTLYLCILFWARLFNQEYKTGFYIRNQTVNPMLILYI